MCWWKPWDLPVGGWGLGGGDTEENQKWLLGPGLSTRVGSRAICRDGDLCGTSGRGRATSLCESHSDAVGMFWRHQAPPRGRPCPSPPGHGSLVPRTGGWTLSPEVRDARRADCPPGLCCVHWRHPHSRPGSCATPLLSCRRGTQGPDAHGFRCSTPKAGAHHGKRLWAGNRADGGDGQLCVQGQRLSQHWPSGPSDT